MGRIQIAKLVTQGGGNPCYITEKLPSLKEKVYIPGNAEGLYPNLRINTSYPPPIDSNYILGPFTDQQQPPYWSTNMDNQHDIYPSSFSDVQNIEILCKFYMNQTPSYMEELFNLCSIFTPDIETNNCLGFWDSANQQYWLEYPFSNQTWYWLKLYYDVATYTQTWSISTDGANFTTIGTHAEDRNSELSDAWNNTSSSTTGATKGWFLLGSITKGNGSIANDRTMQSGIIDLKETYIKTNGVIQCQYKPLTPDTIYYDNTNGDD